MLALPTIREHPSPPLPISSNGYGKPPPSFGLAKPKPFSLSPELVALVAAHLQTLPYPPAPVLSGHVSNGTQTRTRTLNLHEDLCALSLVARACRHPAQRALFNALRLTEPIRTMATCRFLAAHPRLAGYLDALAIFVGDDDDSDDDDDTSSLASSGSSSSLSYGSGIGGGGSRSSVLAEDGIGGSPQAHAHAQAKVAKSILPPEFWDAVALGLAALPRVRFLTLYISTETPHPPPLTALRILDSASPALSASSLVLAAVRRAQQSLQQSRQSRAEHSQTPRRHILLEAPFSLLSFHADLAWDSDLAAFLSTQPRLVDLYLADWQDVPSLNLSLTAPVDLIADKSKESDIRPSNADHQPPLLPSLAVLEAVSHRAVTALVPGRPVAYVKTEFPAPLIDGDMDVEMEMEEDGDEEMEMDAYSGVDFDLDVDTPGSDLKKNQNAHGDANGNGHGQDFTSDQEVGHRYASTNGGGIALGHKQSDHMQPLGESADLQSKTNVTYEISSGPFAMKALPALPIAHASGRDEDVHGAKAFVTALAHSTVALRALEVEHAPRSVGRAMLDVILLSRRLAQEKQACMDQGGKIPPSVQANEHLHAFAELRFLGVLEVPVYGSERLRLYALLHALPHLRVVSVDTSSWPAHFSPTGSGFRARAIVREVAMYAPALRTVVLTSCYTESSMVKSFIAGADSTSGAATAGSGESDQAVGRRTFVIKRVRGGYVPYKGGGISDRWGIVSSTAEGMWREV